MSERSSLSKNQIDNYLQLDSSEAGLLVDELQISETLQNSEFNDFVTPLNNMVVGNESRFGYSHIGPYDREYWWIPMDHCYARPFNGRSESTFLRPTKTLFMQKQLKRRTHFPGGTDYDYLDVETVPEPTSCIYDKTKATQLMNECERHATLAKSDSGDEDWEEKISKVNWTTVQNRLFNGIANILNNDHLSRLANVNIHHEPIARRTTIDKSVERVRKLLASVSWDPKWTQWLHQLLMDNLTAPYLASYLDILQTLKCKLPTFVDKMMSGVNTNKLSILGYESLFPLMKRPWDPVGGSLMQDKPKKLPGNPIIVFVPSTPISSKRMLKWINLLSSLTTIVTIPSNYGGTAGHKAPMTSCVDQMFVMTRNKIQDIRVDYPGRNIVLLGFGFGATLALQVAQVEQVLCVISIGFSLITAEGKRGEPDDNLLELQCPVLFIIGQCSNTSLQEDMEDLRERMRVETGLIIVGSADDNLRVNKKKKLSEGITQSIVDRCIADEIGEFISGVILSPYPPQIRQSPTNLTTDPSSSKKGKTERKRYNSNTSSVDSEPPSPTPRITRPGQNNTPNMGRPPGSKSKSKLESKWAAQGTPSTPPSISPPPTSILGTPDTSSTDSSNLTDKTFISEPPIKKIKTLKPTVPPHSVSEKSSSSSPIQTNTSQQPARAMNLQNRSLSSLLQGDFQNMGPSKRLPPGIKVLENVKFAGGGNTKYFSNTGKLSGKLIDMSKISVINAKGNSGNSIVLLPDGKIKNLPQNIRTQAGRFITSKRQLMGNKAPKPVKKIQYISQPTLPPPTNLTTQDIMDLPIIFADDNQMLENTLIQTEPKKNQPQIAASTPSKFISTNTTGNKFVVLNNKPNHFIIPTNSKAGGSSGNNSQANKMTPKYTKIILSKKTTDEIVKPINANLLAKISNLSSEISVKKIGTPKKMKSIVEEVDLENEIAASTLYKPINKENVVEKTPEELTPEVMMENLFKRTLEEGAEKEEGPSNKLIKLG